MALRRIVMGFEWLFASEEVSLRITTIIPIGAITENRIIWKTTNKKLEHLSKSSTPMMSAIINLWEQMAINIVQISFGSVLTPIEMPSKRECMENADIITNPFRKRTRIGSFFTRLWGWLAISHFADQRTGQLF